MKKFDLILFLCLCCATAFARDRKIHNALSVTPVQNTDLRSAGAAKTLRTTGSGDTTWYSNVLFTDTLTVYPVASGDSGYFTGTNVFGDNGFAERYHISVADSTISVIGVYALFAGTVNPASTNNITFKIWSESDPVEVSQTTSYSGYPNTILDSVVVPFTQLGIGQGSSVDTQKGFYFLPPWVNTGNTFFAGFTLDYDFNSLNGDTIAVQCTKNGERHTPDFLITINIVGTDTTVDTTVIVQNATQWADNNWYDNYTQNDSLFNHLAIFPIVIIGNPNGVKGITKNNLSFMGNMPNPANDHTDILLSLARPDGVQVSVSDMQGRSVLNKNWNGLSSGTQVLNLDTHTLAPGSYIYTVHTSSGDGFASKLEVVK